MILKNWTTKSGLVRKDQPDQGSLHVLRPLNSLSIAYWGDQKQFVASRFFTQVPVQNQADMYWKYPRGAFLKVQMELRAPNSQSRGSGWDMQMAQFITQVYAFHHDIPDQRRANADGPLNQDKVATRFVTWQAMLHRELLFAQTYLATGKWSVDYTGVAAGPTSVQFVKWSVANSTPIEDVQRIKSLAEKANGGFKLNKGLITRDVWDVLKNHSEIVGRVIYGGTNGQPAKVTLQAVAGLFELDSLEVMESMYDTSNEGGTEALSYFATGKFLLVHDQPAGIEAPCPAVTFNWTGYTGTTSMGYRIKKFRMEDIGSDRIEIEQAYAPYIIASDLGTLLNTCI